MLLHDSVPTPIVKMPISASHIATLKMNYSTKRTSKHNSRLSTTTIIKTTSVSCTGHFMSQL